jgi:hypothetical protein
MTRWTLTSVKVRILSLSLRAAPLSRRYLMFRPWRPNLKDRGQDGDLSSLNVAIDALNRTKETTSVIPAKAAFTSAGILLTTIRVGFFRFMLADRWLMYTGLDDL